MKLILYSLLVFMVLVKCEKVNFTCDYVTINFVHTDYRNNNFRNCCNASEFLETSGENDTLVPSNFSPESSIQCFYAENNNFTYFPSNIEKIDATLTHVTIKNSGVKFISAKCFETMVSLEYLDISHNQIEVLENNLFTNRTSLTYINLSNNKIRFIHPEAFIMYQHYKYLDLRNNSCTSELYQETTATHNFVSALKRNHSCSTESSPKGSTIQIFNHISTSKPSTEDSFKQEIRKLYPIDEEHKHEIQKLKDQIKNLENLLSNQTKEIKVMHEYIKNINTTWNDSFLSVLKHHSIAIASNYTFMQTMNGTINDLRNALLISNDSTNSQQQPLTANSITISNESLLIASNALCFFIIFLIIIYLICTKRSSKDTPMPAKSENEASSYEQSGYDLPETQINYNAPDNIYQQLASYEEISYEKETPKNSEIEDFYAEVANRNESNDNEELETYAVAYKSSDHS